MKKKTILLVGGGTGGHIVPILNIYKIIKQKYPDISIITVGGKTSIDKKLYTDTENHISLTTGKLHRTFNLNNILQLLYLISGFVKSFLILLEHKPDIIFSKAGYVSLPIVFWAKIFKIPYFIHESDIVIGKSNQFASSGAKKIFVGFPSDNYPKKLQNKIVYVGQILRSEIDDISGHTFNFGFNNERPVIFITGGSQGARNINNAVFNSLDQLLDKYNLIHHVGSLDYQKAIEIKSKLNDAQKKFYFVSELLTNNNSKDSLLSAVSQSKLVVSRSSATTLGEVSALRKPIITIPYKHAASDHQTKNALFYQRAKAAVLLHDSNINNNLGKEINSLFNNPDGMKQMAENAFNLLPRDGLTKVVEEIISFVKNEKYEEL
ncbi:MAG: UDP-N-acetylglucosamine--N-acetylmuramyl-(pentapeptide) pyrophosphoryl-undecaprenol N-acetylglucosamine transferase [Patescibacteria group bacterium]